MKGCGQHLAKGLKLNPFIFLQCSMHGLDSGLSINHRSPFGQQCHQSFPVPTSLFSVPLQKDQREGFGVT